MDRPLHQNTEQHHLDSVESCPLCEGHRLHVRFNIRHITDDPIHSFGLELGLSTVSLFECDGCGFLFKGKQPPLAYIHQHYSKSGERYFESLAEDQYRIREDLRVGRRLLLKHFPQGGSILDIGCASGFFLESLGKNWNRHGLELSQWARERGRGRSSIIFHEGDIGSAGFENNSFDVISSFDVIEHLPKPMSIFREARRILKPGGWLLLGTGDASSLTARASGNRWTYLCIPEHLSFFGPRCLRMSLDRVGFSRFDFRRIHHGERNRSVATGWIRAVGKHLIVSALGKNIDRLGIFRQRAGEFLVPYFFDHMLCVAK